MIAHSDEKPIGSFLEVSWRGYHLVKFELSFRYHWNDFLVNICCMYKNLQKKLPDGLVTADSAEVPCIVSEMVTDNDNKHIELLQIK